MGDLLDMQALAEKTEALLAHHNVWLKAAGEAEIISEEIIAPLQDMRETLIPFLGEVWALLDDYRRKGQRILLGAQGVMLDIDHGTYPFVIIKHCSGSSAAGSGIGPGSGLSRHHQSLYNTRGFRSVRLKTSVMMVRPWACAGVSLALLPGASVAAAGLTRSWCVRLVLSQVLTVRRSPSLMCWMVLKR